MRCRAVHRAMLPVSIPFESTCSRRAKVTSTVPGCGRSSRMPRRSVQRRTARGDRAGAQSVNAPCTGPCIGGDTTPTDMLPATSAIAPMRSGNMCRRLTRTVRRRPGGASPSAALRQARCARCARRPRRFASRTPFCYLCPKESDAERAHGSLAGRLAQAPRWFESPVVAGFAPDRGCGRGSFVRPPGGREFSHTCCC